MKFNCLTSVVICNARVTTDDTTKNYIGLTKGTFKQRFMQHKHSFRHRSHMKSTKLSNYIWQLRDSNKGFSIKWTIICRARPHSNMTKTCDLCTTEKLMPNFMPETLKLSKTLKPSRDDLTSSIKMVNTTDAFNVQRLSRLLLRTVPTN